MISRGLIGGKFLNLKIVEREIPPLRGNDVLVKVLACGICGTDLHYVTTFDDPQPLGHEISAEVVEIGKEVNFLKPGDRVIVEDCTLCGVCDDCKRGESELCMNKYTIGDYPGIGQYMVVRENSLVKYEGIDPVTACLTEPLTVAVNAVLDSDIPLGGSVAVLGCGPLGLMTAKVAKLKGAGYVYISELNTDSELGRARTNLAYKMGVDHLIDLQKEDIEESVKKRFPKGVDRVIVSSPPITIKDALKIAKYGATIVYYGLDFNGKNIVDIDFNEMVFNKTTLKPFYGEPALNFPISLDILRRGLLPVDEFITDRVTLDQSPDIFEKMVNRTSPVIKAVVLPNG